MRNDFVFLFVHLSALLYINYLFWQERAQFVASSVVHSFDKLRGLHFGCVSIILIALNPVDSARISQYVMKGSKGSIVWSRGSEVQNH